MDQKKLKPCICGKGGECFVDCEDRMNKALEGLYKTLKTFPQGGIVFTPESNEAEPIIKRNQLNLQPIPPSLSIPPSKVLATDGEDWMVGFLEWVKDDGGKVVGVRCVDEIRVEGVGLIKFTMINILEFCELPK